MPMLAQNLKPALHSLHRLLLKSQTMLLRSHCRCCSCILDASAVYAVLCPNCASSLPGQTNYGQAPVSNVLQQRTTRCVWCAMPSQQRQCKACLRLRAQGQAVYETHVVCDYNDQTNDWIHFFKSTGHWPSALFMSQQIVKVLGSTVLARLAASQGSQAKVTLIAVPSSRERLLQRGFNPAQVLALGLQRHLVNYPSLAITVMPDLIFKTKHTSRQG